MKKQKKVANPPKAKKSRATKSKGEGFPGYPLYPANEDIMNKAKRIDVDLNTAVENDQPIANTPANQEPPTMELNDEKSDLTKDDFQALASEEIHTGGDDEILRKRIWPVDFAANDLDIPGSEQDDAQELVGSEDEENNSYSVGGDRHDDLEEDHT